MSTPEPIPTSKTTPVKAPVVPALTDIQVSATTIKAIFGTTGNVAPLLKDKVTCVQGKYSLTAVYDVLNGKADHPDRKALFVKATELQAATDKANEAKRTLDKKKKTKQAGSVASDSRKANEALQALTTDLAYWSAKLNEATRKINEIKVQLPIASDTVIKAAIAAAVAGATKPKTVKVAKQGTLSL
jgi:hypothetical protein